MIDGSIGSVLGPNLERFPISTLKSITTILRSSGERLPATETNLLV